MSLKYSNTTADFLQWDEAMNLIRKLFKDKNYSMSLLIALGCFFGLRISDIPSLSWNQILDINEFTIIEHKTGKKRTIRINSQLQRHIADLVAIPNKTLLCADVNFDKDVNMEDVTRMQTYIAKLIDSF